MPWPAKDDPHYQAYKDAYNERRRKRRSDPEYMARSRERWAAQKERRKAEEMERRYGKDS